MKLTPGLLKKLVMEEVAKLKSDNLKDDGAKEVDADEFADTLEKHIDIIKALRIKEAKLNQQLKLVRERKARLTKRVLGSK